MSHMIEHFLDFYLLHRMVEFRSSIKYIVCKFYGYGQSFYFAFYSKYCLKTFFLS